MIYIHHRSTTEILLPLLLFDSAAVMQQIIAYDPVIVQRWYVAATRGERGAVPR